MKKARILIGALSLSAAAFVGRIAHEGYTTQAVIPTKGDVPTVGFGSTVKEDGSRVKMGDTTTPVQAVRRALVHIQRDEARIKDCIGEEVMLHQAEFDVYSELAYNIGTVNFCQTRSGGVAVIPRHLQAGDYLGACDAILQYKFAAGYDCSTLVNGRPNTRCYGVWKDRLRLHEQCIGAQ